MTNVRLDTFRRMGPAVAAALLLALPLLAPVTLEAQSARVPTPTEVIGFNPGDDYVLADLEQLYAYYQALADASPRVMLEEIGRSTRGEPMLLMTISSPENLARLDHYRSIAERLARARDLTEDEARALAREGKAVVWIDTGLHSAEVATSQHTPHLAYHMATDDSEETLRILDDVILLLMPQMNPDGHTIMVDWYRRVARTEHEFTAPPEVWHEYIGHDINRDWYMIRHDETKVIAHQLYERWYPQIVFNHHQHSPFPTQIFIPPFSDPLNPNIHPLVVRGVNMVGEHMAKRFEEEEMPGVVSGLTFTMWWNGGMRTAPYFHNMVGILSEVQHRFASPRCYEESDIPEFIQAGSRRISTREPSIFYANPWRGGCNTIGQAVQYHFVSSMGALDIGSRLREDWLLNIWRMGNHQIRRGAEGGPFAYLFDLDREWDSGEAVELLNVLRRGGVEVHRATAPFRAEGREYPVGTYIAYASQAFRPHLVDLMEKQEHPHREIYPGGPPEPPYGGLAGWTLPMQMGVHAVRVETPFQASAQEVEWAERPARTLAGSGSWGIAFPAARNDARAAVNALLAEGIPVHLSEVGFTAAGVDLTAGAYVARPEGASRTRVEAILGTEHGLPMVALDAAPAGELRELRAPRVGMYLPWTGNMDEGWTRFILHGFGFDPEPVRNADLQGGDLSRWDVILFADQSAQSILNGHRPGTMPDEFTGGVGEEGSVNLRRWVEGGGTLVTFDGASDFAIRALELPVENATSHLTRAQLYIPGSVIRIRVDTTHPVALGMQRETGAFYQESRAFRILDETRATPVAHYADGDLLMSGWEVGAEEHLPGLPAVVHVRVGEGEAVLIGFRPQFRAQPTGTYKLFLNPILGSAAGGG